MALAPLIHDSLGNPSTVSVTAFDGSSAGPPDARLRVVVKNRNAIRRLLQRPGELGLVRAYVSGDLDGDGDIYTLVELAPDGRERNLPFKPNRALIKEMLAVVGTDVLKRVPPPPEEARPHGRVHSKSRDSEAVSYHYDVSNEFYELVLGPAMTYSCAVFDHEDQALVDAQANKHELICQKLRVTVGTRLLDVGCGWGSMLLHAAQHHGARGVGITISRQQYELATKRVADAGLAGQIEIRLQDYRDTDDGPFDAISSVGMFEHVGRAKMPVYNRKMFDLLRPGGRFLNHGICRPAHAQSDSALGRFKTGAIRTATAVGSSTFSEIKSPFIERYVFPDGELHEVGTIAVLMDEAGFEIRHTENLREHYALTLRNWVKNLEDNWDEAVAEAGEGRARVWRLYMAASVMSFEHHVTEIHQVLAVKPDNSQSYFPLRPTY